LSLTRNQKKNLEEDARAHLRWEAAKKRWASLGFWEKVYYLQAHLQDEAKLKGEKLLPEMAFWQAKEMIGLPLFENA
jgi:hypothetical protein